MQASGHVGPLAHIDRIAFLAKTTVSNLAYYVYYYATATVTTHSKLRTWPASGEPMSAEVCCSRRTSPVRLYSSSALAVDTGGERPMLTWDCRLLPPPPAQTVRAVIKTFASFPLPSKSQHC